MAKRTQIIIVGLLAFASCNALQAAKPKIVFILADDVGIEPLGCYGELNMCLVFGFAEGVGDDVFNCAVGIDRTGRTCGKHHEMQFADEYHPSWWFHRLGTQSRALDTPYGRCGLTICNDRWNPSLARNPLLDGI